MPFRRSSKWPIADGTYTGAIRLVVYDFLSRNVNLYQKYMSILIIDIEYNKRLDRQRPCLEGDFNGGSNNIVQSNKSV